MKNLLSAMLLSAFFSSVSFAQSLSLSPFSPSRSEMLERYKTAAEKDSLVRKTTFKLSVNPNWSGGSAFWYRNILADSAMQYFLVDPNTNTKKPLFDAEKLAAVLAQAGHKKGSAQKLPIKNAYLYPDQKTLAISVDSVFYNLDLTKYHLSKIDSLPVDKTEYPGLTRVPGRWQRNRLVKTSPDQQWNIVLKDNNIFLESVKEDRKSHV